LTLNVPDESVPDESVLDESIPDESIPDESVPDEGIPDEDVPDEGYSRNVLCTLNLISVFLLKIHIECDSIPSHI
jgi:hypothetical protein